MLKLKLQYFGYLNTKSWLIWKDSDAGKDWWQKEKGTTENEMADGHHWLNAHEFEQALGNGEGQGSLACCSPWGHKESDTKTINTQKNHHLLILLLPFPTTYVFFPQIHWRCNWHLTLCKCKLHSLLIWRSYIVKYLHHSVSLQYLHHVTYLLFLFCDENIYDPFSVTF